MTWNVDWSGIWEDTLKKSDGLELTTCGDEDVDYVLKDASHPGRQAVVILKMEHIELVGPAGWPNIIEYDPLQWLLRKYGGSKKGILELIEEVASFVFATREELEDAYGPITDGRGLRFRVTQNEGTLLSFDN